MKKIKLITKYLPLLILFFVFTENSFAQNPSLFDVSTPIRQEKIKNIQTTQAVSLLPFTTLIIKPGSFQEDVTLYVYKGDFDNIKAVLPKGQSPISSYYLVFKIKDDSTTYPVSSLTIESYNNYINTNTFFYPITTDGVIDKENQKEWPGHIRVRTDLPTKNNGFIVAANIDLDKNEQSLNPTITNSAPSESPKTVGSFINQNIFLIAIIIIIVISILGITFVLLKGSKKSNK